MRADWFVKSSGLLVFAKAINAGIGLDGLFDEGALRVGVHVGGKSIEYQSVTGASVGLQADAQSTAIVFLFMAANTSISFAAANAGQRGADA